MTRFLLDTNLLVLLLVGTFNRRLISQFKRTRGFSAQDFENLLKLLPDTARLVATPHVLAETSNLIRGLDGQVRTAIRAQLRLLVGKLQEDHVPARRVVSDPLYLRLGITDAGISVLAATRDIVVVTEDLDLYIGLQRAGLKVINFNHHRIR